MEYDNFNVMLKAVDLRVILCVICLVSHAKSGAVTFISRFVVLSFIAAFHLPFALSLVLPKPMDWLSHSRLRELCLHRQGGHEGKTIKGFKLSQAFVVNTPGLLFHPGERDLDGQTSQSCFFDAFSRQHPSSKLRAYTELLQYKYLLKEGDQAARSAFQIFPPVPDSRNCTSGMMTSLGIAQSIWLGEYFSLAYHELWSLNKDMAVARTVGDEVLYQAATALLYGLLHEKQFVKNHVKKMDVNYGLGGGNINHRVSVPGFSKDHVHHFIQSSFEKEHHIFKDTSSPTMSREKIKRLTGGADVSAKRILSFTALKYCPRARPLRRSTSVEDKADTFSLSHVLSQSDFHNNYLSKDTFFQSYAISRTRLLRKFLQTWVNSPKSKHNPEVNLITVDDLFFLSLLTSLKKTDGHHIPPVSRLVFEKFAFNSSSPERMVGLYSRSPLKVAAAHSNMNIHQNYHYQFFRVLLNGKVVTREIGGCSSDPMVGLGLCSSPSIFAALSDLVVNRISGSAKKEEL